LRRICVQKPYNRLENLAPFGGAGVAASVTFEAPVGLEAGYLASAEIGRHLAILGSCALARNNPSDERHYYLAHRALLRRFTAPHVRQGEPLRLVAVPFEKDSADVELRDHRDQVIASLSVDYRLLSGRLFARLFRAHFRDASASSDAPSPYGTPVPFEGETHAVDSAHALLSEVTPALCAGHFQEYPALPVAILMDGINRLACAHLFRSTSKEIALATCAVKAEQLAFAGESLQFSVKRTFETHQSAIYHGSVTRASDGTVFGEAALSYEVSSGVRRAPSESGMMEIRRPRE